MLSIESIFLNKKINRNKLYILLSVRLLTHVFTFHDMNISVYLIVSILDKQDIE